MTLAAVRKSGPNANASGNFPVYGPLKVRGFGFIDSGCHLLVNLLSQRRPEDTLESCSGKGKSKWGR